jgi:hypothetical protein
MKDIRLLLSREETDKEIRSAEKNITFCFTLSLFVDFFIGMIGIFLGDMILLSAAIVISVVIAVALCVFYKFRQIHCKLDFYYLQLFNTLIRKEKKK